MSDKRVQEIEARLKAATPGPWSFVEAETGLNRYLVRKTDGGKVAELDRGLDGCRDYRRATSFDACLIAHAPTDLAYLLAEVKRLSTLLTMGKPDPRGLEAAIATETAINKAQVKEDW